MPLPALLTAAPAILGGIGAGINLLRGNPADELNKLRRKEANRLRTAAGVNVLGPLRAQIRNQAANASAQVGNVGATTGRGAQSPTITGQQAAIQGQAAFQEGQTSLAALDREEGLMQQASEVEAGAATQEAQFGEQRLKGALGQLGGGLAGTLDLGFAGNQQDDFMKFLMAQGFELPGGRQ